MDLEERIIRYLAACPPAISNNGGHNSTFTVACALVNGFALDHAAALHYLNLYNQRCQPAWSDKDLEHKISSAQAAQHSKIRGHLIGGSGAFKSDDFKNSSFPAKAKAAAKPMIDPSTAIENFLQGRSCGEADIWEASPIRPPDDFGMDAICLLENLYYPGEIINFITDYTMSKTKSGVEKAIPAGYGRSIERNELMDEWSLSMPSSKAGVWVRMNPTDGQGIADKNITKFRFILMEFDSIPLDLQLSLFAFLPLPIAAILTSGGKSVHAWVKVDAENMEIYKEVSYSVLSMLSRFGMDDKNKNPSRLSRLVGVNRSLGAAGDGRQRLLYLNPTPNQKAIL